MAATRILVVEDEFLIALDIAGVLEQAGLAVIGPAGGWDDSELDLARKKGFQIVTCGGRILRAETAAIAFAAILQHRFGDLH